MDTNWNNSQRREMDSTTRNFERTTLESSEQLSKGSRASCSPCSVTCWLWNEIFDSKMRFISKEGLETLAAQLFVLLREAQSTNKNKKRLGQEPTTTRVLFQYKEDPVVSMPGSKKPLTQLHNSSNYLINVLPKNAPSRLPRAGKMHPGAEINDSGHYRHPRWQWQVK